MATKYHERIIEALSYMIETKTREDADLINDPENIKAAAIQNHTYVAIKDKKRKNNRKSDGRMAYIKKLKSRHPY